MRERDARVGAHFRSTCDTAKREQKAAGVLGRSVKCLNKRAIILTRSGISGVFQPFESIAPPPTFFAALSIWNLPSLLLPSQRSVCLFSSRFWGPRRRCRRPGAHVKSTRHAFHSLPVLSLWFLFMSRRYSDRQPFPALSLLLPRIVSSTVAIARRQRGVAFATQTCYDFQLTESGLIKIRDK